MVRTSFSHRNAFAFPVVGIKNPTTTPEALIAVASLRSSPASVRSVSTPPRQRNARSALFNTATPATSPASFMPCPKGPEGEIGGEVGQTVPPRRDGRSRPPPMARASVGPVVSSSSPHAASAMQAARRITTDGSVCQALIASTARANRRPAVSSDISHLWWAKKNYARRGCSEAEALAAAGSTAQIEREWLNHSAFL